MEIKNICYFRKLDSAYKTIQILDCGYHETVQGRPSSQTVVDHYILHCIVSGEGIYRIEDRTYHLKANDCFLLVPNVPILYQSDSLNPWVYYWIGFEGIEASRLMQLCGMGVNTPTLCFREMDTLAAILRPLLSLDTASISDSYLALSQFYVLCSNLIRQNRSIKPLSRKEHYVNQAIALIQDSYYRDISVQTLSGAIGLDRTYLYRIFKEISGMTVQQYITGLRMKRACHFLSTSMLSYSEVARYCGYSSEQYFSMVFKKNIGMSPSAYRKSGVDIEKEKCKNQ